MRYQIFIGESADWLCYYGTGTSLANAIEKVRRIPLCESLINHVMIRPHPADFVSTDDSRANDDEK